MIAYQLFTGSRTTYDSLILCFMSFKRVDFPLPMLPSTEKILLEFNSRFSDGCRYPSVLFGFDAESAAGGVCWDMNGEEGR